jgi:hypothetical protein
MAFKSVLLRSGPFDSENKKAILPTSTLEYQILGEMSRRKYQIATEKAERGEE